MPVRIVSIHFWLYRFFSLFMSVTLLASLSLCLLLSPFFLSVCAAASTPIKSILLSNYHKRKSFNCVHVSFSCHLHQNPETLLNLAMSGFSFCLVPFQNGLSSFFFPRVCCCCCCSFLPFITFFSLYPFFGFPCKANNISPSIHKMFTIR